MNAADSQGKAQQRHDARATRDAAMIVMRNEGATLDEIGKRFGITRERARQILTKANATGAAELRLRRVQQREEDARALIDSIRQDVLANPGSTRTEIAARLEVDRQVVVRLLDPDVAAFVVDETTKGPRSQFSDEEIIAAVRDAGTYEFPLTGSAYQRLVTLGEVAGPSLQMVNKRLRSWTRACELAGVEPDRQPHSGYQSRWTDGDLLACVVAYLQSPRSRGTYAGYDSWARGQADAPSGPSLRNRLGPWSEIKRAALQSLSVHEEREGRVSG